MSRPGKHALGFLLRGVPLPLRRSPAIPVALLAVLLYALFHVAMYYRDEWAIHAENRTARQLYESAGKQQAPVRSGASLGASSAATSASPALAVQSGRATGSGAAGKLGRTATGPSQAPPATGPSQAPPATGPSQASSATGPSQAPPAAAVPAIQPRFRPLLARYPDIAGWVKIAGTAIDYPVMHTTDNAFYLTHDAAKRRNVNGSIFLDYRNRIRGQDRHLILYGHEMLNRTMFYSLLLYADRTFFERHPYIEFDTLYADHRYRVFSAYYTTAQDDYLRTQFRSADDFRRYAVGLQRRSLHPTDVTIGGNRPILTLSTCAANAADGRFVVHAVLAE